MMREAVLDAFRAIYGRAPAYLIRAPGRANLIGEHTDYNDGFVMPLALDRALWLAVSPRDDAQMALHSLDFGGDTARFTTNQLQDESLPAWTRHVRGGWWLLGRKGYDLPGAEVVIGSEIPAGAGMSSSAAIGVAVVEAALALAGDAATTQAEKALLAVEIEHEFFHMPCGVMDQMASAAAIDGAAMLLDCRTLATMPVALPREVRVVVMNTMMTRQLTGSGYADRRRESEAAAAVLGVPALRDATLEMVEARQEALGGVGARRARHVITENARTLAMPHALMQGELEAAGRLLDASHASQRDDYEVSIDEMDAMCEIARAHPACYGARMMGGGFGGSAVGLVRADEVNGFIRDVAAAYEARTGITPEMYVGTAAPGSTVERIGEA